MDLPNLFNVNVAQAGQRVCVVVLTERSVLAGLLAVHASGSQMLRISEQVVFSDDDTMLVAIDQVLLELGDAAADVNEVVFCLEQKWLTESGELVPEKQEQLKKIKDGLSLKPVGYVLQHETITEHLINQQPQLSGLVLFLSGESITATLVMHGAVDVTVAVGRSKEIQSDVVEALSQIAQKSGRSELPGKLLCSTIALEVAELFELQQELLTVVWPETVRFLQLPVVEVIKPQLCAQIVVTGAGKALQQLEEGVVATPPVSPKASSSEENIPAVIPEGPKTALIEEEYAVETPTSVSTASSFGIPITSIPPQVTFSHDAPTATQTDAPFGETAVDTPRDVLAAVSKKNPLSNLLAHITKQDLSKPTRKQIVIGCVLASLAGLLIVGLIGFFFLSSVAQLELKIQPKTMQLSQEVELTLDPTLVEPDVQNRKIRAEKLTIELSSTDKTDATGIKIVGEKAKGSIVLYNKTNAAKTFVAGTIVKKDALQYVLDETVEVPAATVSAKPGGTGEEKEYGQKSTKVTASVIGIDNNIEKDINLSVADFDAGTYSAKSESALSGGSSREVRVVQQSDLDVLVADVKKELLTQAKAKLEEQQGKDQRVIPLDTLEIVKQTFSAKEGAEIDSVTLDLTVKATGLAYYTTDLVPIAQALMTNLVPSGYSLDGHEPQILSAGTASGTSKVLVTVNLSSKAHALVEVEQLKKQLASQTFAEATSMLQANPQVEKASFVVKPEMARSLLKKVPADSKRFSVTIDIAK